MTTASAPARPTDEPLELFARWQRDGDRAARERLTERYMPLARKMARRYAGAVVLHNWLSKGCHIPLQIVLASSEISRLATDQHSTQDCRVCGGRWRLAYGTSAPHAL